MDFGTPGFPVYHQTPEFTQTHIHRVSHAIQPLSSPSSLAFNLSQHQSENESCSDLSDYLWPHGLYPRNSPGQNTGVGSLSLLQGSLLTQGPNPDLLHCRWILYQLIYEGTPTSGSFQMSQLFTSGDQIIGVSASTSVLQRYIQDWFPLRWTVWISLQSKELSEVFSNTIV